MKKAAENPQPQPDPALEAEKMKAEGEKAKMEFEGQKMQQDKYLADQNFALEQQKLGVEKEKISADLTKTRIDAKTKVSPDLAMTDNDMNEGEAPIAVIMAQMTNALGMIAQMQQQGNQAVIEAIQNPPPRQVIRDANGNIAGVH